MYRIINENDVVLLSDGEAVIVCKYDGGVFFELMPSGHVERVEFESTDSVILALNAIVTKAGELGYSLLQEDSISAMSKSRALDSVFSSHAEEYWQYAYFCSMKERKEHFSSPMAFLSGLYEGQWFDDIADALETKYISFMSFAEFVTQQQPKVWLLTTDYDGGCRDSWVVKGSYVDAKKSMIEALNEIIKEEVTFESFESFIENRVGHDDDYIYTASIEEVS